MRRDVPAPGDHPGCGGLLIVAVVFLVLALCAVPGAAAMWGGV